MSLAKERAEKRAYHSLSRSKTLSGELTVFSIRSKIKQVKNNLKYKNKGRLRLLRKGEG